MYLCNLPSYKISYT